MAVWCQQRFCSILGKRSHTAAGLVMSWQVVRGECVEMMESGLDHYHPAVCTVVRHKLCSYCQQFQKRTWLCLGPRPSLTFCGAMDQTWLWMVTPTLAASHLENRGNRGGGRWAPSANSVRHTMSVLEKGCGTLNFSKWFQL